MIKPLQWILDNTPSAEAKANALKVVQYIIYAKEKTNAPMLRKMWTDGTYWFDFMVSDHINRIRVWSENVDGIRFWIYADGERYGLYKAGSQWKIMVFNFTEGVVSTIDDGFTVKNIHQYLPVPFNYEWVSENNTYQVCSGKPSIAPSRFFWRSYQLFGGHYARLGGSFHIFRVLFGGGYAYITESYEKNITDDSGSIEREYPYHLNPLGYMEPYPHTDVTLGTQQFTPSLLNTLNGRTIQVNHVSAVIKNNEDLIAIGPVYNAQMFSDGSITSPSIYAPRLDSNLFAKSSLYYPISLPAHWPYSVFIPPVSSAYMYMLQCEYNVVSPDALKILGAFEPVRLFLNTGILSSIGDPVWAIITLNHDDQTAVAIELGPHASVQDTTITSVSGAIPDPITAEFSYVGNSRQSTTYTMNGYSFDTNNNVVNMQIVKTIDRVFSFTSDGTEVDNDPPPGTHIQVTQSGETTVKNTLQIIIDGIEVFIEEGTIGSSSNTESGPTGYTIPGDIKLILHDYDAITDSYSFSVIATTQEHDLVETLTKTITYSEYTKINGVVQPTMTKTSVVTESISIYSMPHYGNEYTSIGDTSKTTDETKDSTDGTKIDNAIDMNVHFESTGTGHRFLRDRSGHTLAFCPVGQEAYWELDGDNASPKPTKWRTDGRETIFKLYDSDGNEIDLTHLELVDVECISACDGLVVEGV